MLGERLPNSVREILVDTYKAQVRALEKYQSPEGLWHTVIDDPSSYPETSGSAGFAYGILRGLHTGLLDPSFEEMAEKAVRGILSQIADDGTVQNVSAGTPVGRSAEHYKNIIIEPMAYGQALCLMALSEAVK